MKPARPAAPASGGWAVDATSASRVVPAYPPNGNSLPPTYVPVPSTTTTPTPTPVPTVSSIGTNGGEPSLHPPTSQSGAPAPSGHVSGTTGTATSPGGGGGGGGGHLSSTGLGQVTAVTSQQRADAPLSTLPLGLTSAQVLGGEVGLFLLAVIVIVFTAGYRGRRH